MRTGFGIESFLNPGLWVGRGIIRSEVINIRLIFYRAREEEPASLNRPVYAEHDPTNIYTALHFSGGDVATFLHCIIRKRRGFFSSRGKNDQDSLRTC